MLDDLVRLGEATGARESGEVLLAELQARLDRCGMPSPGARRPSVVALEWLDPPYAGGHWVPEMIALAGGRSVAGEPGRDSRTASWAELEAARPQVVVVMPCGLYAEEAAQQALARRERLESLGAERIYAVDAASSFSRPGPRLVEGTELLAPSAAPGSRRPRPAAWAGGS